MCTNDVLPPFPQNIRIMAKYYTRITMKRMAGLLDLSVDVSSTLTRNQLMYEAHMKWHKRKHSLLHQMILSLKIAQQFGYFEFKLLGKRSILI